MSRLFIPTSEGDLTAALSIRQAGDRVLCPTILSDQNCDGSVDYFSVAPGDFVGLARQFQREIDDLGQPYYWHANNLYSSLASVNALVVNIQEILAHGAVTEIVLGHRVAEAWLPVYLTGWGEASRCWMTNLSLLINGAVEQAFASDVSVTFMRRRFLGKIRDRLLVFARTVSTSMLACVMQLRKVRWGRPKLKPRSQPRYLVCVRSRHQLRSARMVIDSLELAVGEYLVLEAEMLASRGLDQELQRSQLPVRPVFYRWKGVGHCVSSFWTASVEAMQILVAGPSFAVQGDAGAPVKFRRASVLADTWMHPQTLAYRRGLLEIFDGLSAQQGDQLTLLSFEQVSPHAGAEAAAAKETGLRTAGFKTTMIEPKATPIVSPFDCFFVETEEQAFQLRMSAVDNPEGIVHSGSLKYSYLSNTTQEETKVVDNENPKTILFATQPHETENCLRIIESISRSLKQIDGYTLVVRPHPRDMTEYSKMCVSGILVDADGELVEAIRSARLVISRTSSVLEEALLAGTPIASIQLSEYDKSSLSIEYLNPEREFVLESLDELERFVSLPTGWASSSEGFKSDYVSRFQRLDRSTFEKVLVASCVE